LNSYQRGEWAEKKAEDFLKNFGLKVIERRFKCPFGEVDLIAQHHSLLVAIEVKYRKRQRAAIESISAKQQRRIIDALNYFISQRPQVSLGLISGSVAGDSLLGGELSKDLSAFVNMRIDVVVLSDNCKPLYIKNAWQDGWF